MTQIVLPLDLAMQLEALLLKADSQGAFERCDDHPHPSGKGCSVCTTLEGLQLAILNATAPNEEE